MGTWKYVDVETKDGYLVDILVHVVENKEKVTLVISSVPLKKKETV